MGQAKTRFEEMTPKERFEAFLTGKDMDRILCCPIIGEAAVSMIGTTVAKFCHSSDLMAEMEITLYKTFHHDSVGVGPDLFGIAEAMGTQLEYPEHDVPYVSVPILRDYKDLDKLPLINPQKDGRLPLFLEAVKRLDHAVGKEVGVGSSVGGPLTTAAALRGTEELLKDMILCPEEVHRLMEVSTENVLKYIDALSEIGIKPSIPEPIASGTLLSQKQFKAFAFPYLKRCVDRIIERFGSAPTLHICGSTKRLWQDMADTGARTLSLDNLEDLENAKKEVGHRVILMGNVKPMETMKYGTREDIFNEVKECIRKTYDSPKGYILSTGCQLPMGTPMENVSYLMEAARTFGSYPFDLGKLI
ncbi:uroporphyrinogen decarboxylase [Anaerosolibacter carboniphilus]|uniref:Uroporphyrinogen decarboxylase n=1 Tax=Anaerosolibacter carboniphilus TaxID=1417629 RepID=A0A841KZ29_9FIRM|nr:uroporphyrinogen decarboxylase family protein [Anaerosolibacter carboniphilus]MBB6219026.1 uroporphyrinogen decarboxylase [Anaerosolibacter carboniphilus]